MSQTDNFYLNQPEPNKSCLLALRDIILQQDEHITPTIKYGMPCFCYKGKMFCYLWVDKKTNHPYILFVEGEHLNHPKLETGTRKRMKTFNVNPNRDLPVATMVTLLHQALELYHNGTVEIK